jgi:hypothetical protein
MEKVMKKRVGFFLVLGVAAFASAVCVGCSSSPGANDKSQGNSILDYFPITPGLKLTYDFASEYNANDNGKRAITFQNPPNDKDFSFQFTRMNAGNFADCLWKTEGDIIGASNSSQNRYNDAAFRYFYLINMPAEYANGMDFSVAGVSYHLTTGNSWMDYSDCIKVSFESPDDFGPPWERPMLGGTGYFYLARGTGLVYLYFENRGTKNIETFGMYKPPKLLAAHRIYGHVQDSAANPLPNVYLALDAWLPLGWCGKTDAQGDFSFAFYYEAEKVYNRGIMLGRDDNGNDVLDNDEAKISSNYINFPDGDMNMGTFTM